MEPDSSVTAPIDPVVAAAERAARCPLPTFVIAPHPNYSKLTAPVAVDADAIIPHPSRPLSGAAIEERDGRILFRVIRNDGASESSILLTGLKNIFQTQLPKMPRDYVGKLVYDKSHISICLIHAVTSKVLGGICFKPFLDRKFAEIVFCAVSNDVQVKGYGAHIMNHLKDHVREIGDIRHFLTYADNYAVGYFKKQGFSLEITLDKSIWMGYIKDYEGGTLMQCTIMPKVPYLDLPRILALQKQAVYRKIFSVSHANVIRPGIKHWPEGGLDPARIPGVAESGWTIELSRERAMPAKSPLHILLTGVVQWLMNHTASWPFKEPVDTKAIPDYLNVIKRPMDLKTMESKVNNDEYITEKEFVDDVQLIVDNCRTYNKKGSVYYQAAQKLERDFYKEFNGSLSM
ncbi:histone acetyltransferase-like protein [Blastocladiella britannica]|nr:histone acetyltransferase-like protein [Blastocladiella britannica]